MPVEGKLAPDGRTKLRSGGVKGQERRAQRGPGHHLRSCLLIKRLCSEATQQLLLFFGDWCSPSEDVSSR